MRAAATLAMFLPRRLSIRLRSTEIFVVSGCRWIRGFNRDTNEVLLQQVRVGTVKLVSWLVAAKIGGRDRCIVVVQGTPG